MKKKPKKCQLGFSLCSFSFPFPYQLIFLISLPLPLLSHIFFLIIFLSFFFSRLLHLFSFFHSFFYRAHIGVLPLCMWSSSRSLGVMHWLQQILSKQQHRSTFLSVRRRSGKFFSFIFMSSFTNFSSFMLFLNSFPLLFILLIPCHHSLQSNLQKSCNFSLCSQNSFCFCSFFFFHVLNFIFLSLLF